MADGAGVKFDMTVNPAMVGGLILQTAIVIWWVSSLNSRVFDLEKSNAHTGVAVEKLNDAREDFRLNVQALTSAIDSQRTALAERTARFDQIQEALSRIERGNIDARSARIRALEEAVPPGAR